MTPASATPTAVRCYAFGDFVVDVHRRLLFRDGKVIPLTSKPFDVLVILIQERARIVEKDEFLQRVWSNTIVHESNLVQRISILRKAFGLRPDDHNVIVTIPGRGYQFVASVDELTELPWSARVEEREEDREDPWPDSNPQARALSETVDEVEGRNRASNRWFELRPMTWVTIGCLVLLGLAALLIRPEPNAPVARSLRQVVFDSALPREPTWSPDGQMLAYTSDRAGNPDIWVQSMVDPSPIRITTSEAPDFHPSWSPDGKFLVFRSERDAGGIFRVSAAGGEPTKLSSFGYRPRWSPKGDRILFEGPSQRSPRALYVVPSIGGTPMAVLPHLISRLASYPGATLSTAWHPDGERLSLLGRDGDGRWAFITASIDGPEMVTSNISDSILRSIDDAGLTPGRFSWAPSSRYVYFEGQTESTASLWRVPVDPATQTWLGPPERLTTNAGIHDGLALSPDGRQLAFTARNQRRRVWSFPVDTRTGLLAGDGAPVTSGDLTELDGDALVDGSTLAYRAVTASQDEVWTYSTESRQQRRLIASTDSRRSTPQWSPDGLHLVYAVSRRPLDRRNTGENRAVAILTLDGGTERLVTTPGEVDFVPRDWSADGRTILGSCDGPSGTKAICTLPVGEGLTSRRAMHVITSDAAHNLYRAEFSPDNRWISFMAVSTKEPNLSRIILLSASGGEWIDVTDGRSYDDKPRWAPEGRTLYFLSDRSGFPNLWGRHMDLDGALPPQGEPFQVTAFQSPQRMLAPWLGPMGMAVSTGQVFVPIVETSGAIWVLNEVDR